MIIKGASVFCEDGTFQVKDVFVEDHKIVATEAEVSDKTVVDANGYKLIPGLVDVHSHGACGHDFCDCDVEGVKEILRFEKAHGITSYCPTSMTLSKEMLVDIFATAKEADGIADGARVIGINMEGPFIAPEKKGAQNGAYIQAPSAETFRACQQASGGLIKLVTLAPEMEGSVEFIKELKDEVHISVGHTTADYDTAKAAFEAGADHVTHLYNAMPPLNHRAPGVIGAAADNDHVYAELISDGLHIHGSAIRAAFRMFGYPAKAISLASFISCSFCFIASWCCRSLAISLLSGIWSSGIARYFWIVLGDECNNNAISDMVSPSLRFSWANFIRNDRFAVLYNAFISSVTLSVNGISTLAGNSRNIYLQITSESPFIK